MQQREEKVFEAVIGALISRVQELKNSITALLLKLETESDLNWPSLLDNFSLISSQVNTLSKILKSEKTTQLRNFVLLPLHLQPEPDPELIKLTEERVPAFNHVVVPDYLRTKPEPEVEQRDKQIMAKVANSAHDAAQKQVAQINKISGHVTDLVSNTKQNWENESGSKTGLPVTCIQSETNLLVSAISFGKHLKGMPGLGSMQRPADLGMPPGGMGKAPSSIKANIKVASNVHPYSRP